MAGQKDSSAWYCLTSWVKVAPQSQLPRFICGPDSAGGTKAALTLPLTEQAPGPASEGLQKLYSMTGSPQPLPSGPRAATAIQVQGKGVC